MCVDSSSNRGALSLVPKGENLSCPLIERTQISSDTFVFKFGLPEKEMTLGLPVGKHIKLL